MSKINPTTRKEKSQRLAGGSGAKAAKQSYIQLLRRATLANLLWEDNAYIDGDSVAKHIERLIPRCEPKDVANLALECRLVQKLRHTPLFIASEMCKYPQHKLFVGDLLPKIITRADMLTDFLAIYWNNGKRPLTNQIKKGLSASFHNFNEYQFAKYDRNGAIKLRDVMFLCHPKANDEAEQELFNKIASRTLKTPDTWEVALSSGADKKETWTRLIEENKLGSLAMLRNLRNMMNVRVDKKVIEKGLSQMHSQMLLPLDFLKARNNAEEFSSEIEDAMLKTYEKLPKLPGKTLFIVDVSGSMMRIISSRSTFTRMDCAKAMAMLAANQCEDFTLVCTAGSDRAKKHQSSVIRYPKKGFGILDQIDEKYDKLGGGGIFTRQCLEWCKDNISDAESYDRIIVFSDSQDCDYSGLVPEPFAKHNYICDVSSEKHGIAYNGVWDAEISGWSEHFLTYIAALEGLENTFVEE